MTLLRRPDGMPGGPVPDLLTVGFFVESLLTVVKTMRFLCDNFTHNPLNRSVFNFRSRRGSQSPAEQQIRFTNIYTR